MKPYDTLIRLSEQQLDDKRRALAALEDRLDQIRAERQAIEDELQHEQRRAAEDAEALFTYGAYAAEVIRRRERADGRIRAIEAEVEAAREDVRLAFAELKRYEITHERKLAAIERERAARRQTELDEIAQTLDRRKNDRL